MDDSSTILARLKDYLTTLGVDATSIRTAGDGEEALERMREQPADVVFLDIEMPRMDGPTAAPQLMEIHPDAKIVVLTAVERGDDRVRRLIANGAFEFLSKPVRLDDLQKVLNLIEREESKGLGRIR